MTSDLISYKAVSAGQGGALLRQYEIPVTHAVSLPLPTIRANSPGYVSFAAPARRTPGKPQLQDPPDRWWIYSALDGRLVTYNLCSAMPLTTSTAFATQELPPPTHPLAELKQIQNDAASLLDMLSPNFFNKGTGDTALRKRLSELLTDLLPSPLMPQYRAAAPDFFDWLEA